VISPPQTTLQGQLDAIRAGRAISDTAASTVGARTVALSTCPWPLTSTLVEEPQYEQMADRFGLAAVEQLTCGFHVHVGINSAFEGVALLGSGVPVDEGMLYFDARLSVRYPTVEVRVADVCLVPGHTAVLATIVRALVETCVRDWLADRDAPHVPASLLKVRSWQASRFGMEDDRRPAPSPAGRPRAQRLSTSCWRWSCRS